jgi:signal transduction histidine kinase
MSSHTLSRIFEPFFTTKDNSGTGLGLWISREIVDRHRGALRIRSSQSNLGSGTVFALFLPFDQDARPPAVSV